MGLEQMDVPAQTKIVLDGAAEADALVSVVIPTFNRPAMLARAIESVLNQTYTNLEIIVVDDASEGDIEAVVKSFDDERIKLIRHEHNHGGSAARNTGIRHSRGRYIAFLDDDDEWLSQKTERQLKDLRKKGPEHKVSFCLRTYFDESLGKDLETSEPGWDGNHLRELLSQGLVASTSCALIEKECFETLGGFREDLPCYQDWEMWIRLAERYDFVFLNEALVRYHLHVKAMISSNDLAPMVSYPIIYRAHRNLFWRNRKALSSFLQRFARESALAGDKRGARWLLLESIVANPLQPSPYMSLVLLFSERLSPQSDRPLAVQAP